MKCGEHAYQFIVRLVVAEEGERYEKMPYMQK